MPDIQEGDLVKYKEPEEHLREKGVWLVVDVKERDVFGASVLILKQGNRQRVSIPHRLNKISSSR